MSDTGPAGEAKCSAMIANERTKLLANALDRSSTACVTVGILAPVAAFLYGIGAAPNMPVNQIAVGVFFWLVTAIVLHLFARLVLGSLRWGVCDERTFSVCKYRPADGRHDDRRRRDLSPSPLWALSFA